MSRLINEALELLQNENTTLETLAKLKQQTKLKKEELSKINEEIEALTSLEKYGEEIEESITFTEEIDNCVFELDKMVKKTFNSQRINTAKKKPGWNLHPPAKKARLPKLEMPTFRGEVLSFPSYWELFDGNINSLTTLTSVHKFSYLKTTLEGEPSTLYTTNLEMTAANYNSALEILKDRYGD